MEINKQYNNGDIAKRYNFGSLKNITNDLGRSFLRKEMLSISKNKIILDVGCGTGLDLQAYKDMGFSKLYGIDPSKKSLTEASKIISKKIGLDIGTFENIPHKDNFFDVVISRHALHYSKKIVSSIEEVGRVLKKGGKFIAIISHPLADSLEIIDKNNNVHVSLFNDEVKIVFPLHKISDYFSERFFDLFELKGVYEYIGTERDGKTKNMNNTLGFVAVKRYQK